MFENISSATYQLTDRNFPGLNHSLRLSIGWFYCQSNMNVLLLASLTALFCPACTYSSLCCRLTGCMILSCSASQRREAPPHWDWMMFISSNGCKHLHTEHCTESTFSTKGALCNLEEVETQNFDIYDTTEVIIQSREYVLFFSISE